jgi:acetyl-CoA synthetase
MAEHRVRTAFLPPTALKLMRQSDVDAAKLRLRACMSGGEPLGREMLAWAEERLGVVVNEIYGQTEANLVVGNCHAAWPVVAGSMGRPFPGHEVAVIDDDGTPVPPGEVGEIGVRAPDPVMFLEYWNQPEATAGKFVGDWLKTGDLGVADEDGYLWFQARADDLINSAGYRIGPGEIEDCLLRHDAVAMVAVVGVPDELRGQVVKAYIEVAPGYEPGEPLADEIKQFVRTRLAAHEYPRQIEFIEALPMTSTGKIRRNVLRDQSATAGAGQQPHTT